jgi:hypothetical protein
VTPDNVIRIQTINHWPAVHDQDPGITWGNLLRRVEACEAAERNRLTMLTTALGNNEALPQRPHLSVAR